MKKTLFLIIFIFCFYFCYASSSNVFDIVNNCENVSFSLINCENNRFFAAIMVNEGKISCGFGGHIEACILSDYEITNDNLIVFFEKLVFRNYSEGETLKYRRWIYPKKYRIEFSKDDFYKALNSKMHDLNVLIDTSQTYPTTCQAIVIDNLNIRDKPSFEGKKIGLLKRRAEVTLYEESKNIDEIDGEKNPWYKVKLEDGTYGWVYGGYVRIFFEDPNLGYSDKEQILKSIE